MNFIQKNPNDPRHGEFHDGEYEYWPADGGLNSSSFSIPAALVSGLELLAAVACAGLLAAALTVLYVLSAPLSISENAATINASVYNNRDDHTITYVLSPGASPDTVLQEGILDEDKDTLNLQGLSGGTAYLLKYYNAEQEEISQFRFTTPGELEIPVDPDPEKTPDKPADPKPDDSVDPAGEPENGKEPAADTEATTGPTEAPIDPVLPGYKPPVVTPARPKPAPESKPEPKPEQKPEPKPEEKPEEETKPEEKPEEEPKPEEPPVPTPAPGAPEISSVKSDTFISGVLDNADLGYTEHFVFFHVPKEYDFKIDWTSTNVGKSYSSEHTYQDGTLTVSVTGAVIFGHRIETTVTVYTSYGEISKTSILSPPELATATLNVVPVENTSNTFAFNVAATTSMEDSSAVTEGMVLTAELLPYHNANPVSFPLTQDPNDPSHYSGTYTTDIPTSATKTASVSVSGYWERNTENIFVQNVYYAHSYG